MTPSDKLFQADAVKRDLGEDWYNFSDKIKDQTCIFCKTKFKTYLRLQRYCKPEHRNQDLRGKV